MLKSTISLFSQRPSYREAKFIHDSLLLESILCGRRRIRRPSEKTSVPTQLVGTTPCLFFFGLNLKAHDLLALRALLSPYNLSFKQVSRRL